MDLIAILQNASTIAKSLLRHAKGLQGKVEKSKDKKDLALALKMLSNTSLLKEVEGMAAEIAKPKLERSAKEIVTLLEKHLPKGLKVRQSGDEDKIGVINFITPKGLRFFTVDVSDAKGYEITLHGGRGASYHERNVSEQNLEREIKKAYSTL